VRRAGRVVLSDVDLIVESGTILWVEGDSGSGKTTLLRSLARLLPLEAGEIRLGDPSAARLPPHVRRSRVVLGAHPPCTLGETVREDLLAPHRLGVRKGRRVPSDGSLRSGLQSMGLGELELDHPTRELSQGQAARVAVSRVLSAEPAVLLLDEPTANLDPRSSRLLAAMVRAFVDAGGALCVAAHAEPWEGVGRRVRPTTIPAMGFT
jgi:energy-coupling factor transporter ATP-binding protein EcfA2